MKNVRWLALSLAALPWACFVQNVEIVDTLDGAGSGAGAPEPPAHGGGGRSSAGGSQPGGAGQAAAETPVPSPGGTGGSGVGSAGAPTPSEGGSGSGGSPASNAIPELKLCASAIPFRHCTDFEMELPYDLWSGVLTGWVLEESSAPSGNFVLELNSVPTLASFDAMPVKVSAWVKVTAADSDRVISFVDVNGDDIGLGVVNHRLRWVHSGAGTMAPSDEMLAPEVPVATWMCVELRADSATSLSGRVVVPGGIDFTLPRLDQVPDEGNDDAWIADIGSWQLDKVGVRLGSQLAKAQFDDVVVADPAGMSVCDEYLKASQAL